MSDTWMIYSMFKNHDEALSVAQALLDRQLVACVNIIDGLTSVYRWQDSMQQEKESAMIVKTSGGKVSNAMDCIKELHTYQLPCIVSWPLSKGYPPFMEWVADETKDK